MVNGWATAEVAPLSWMMPCSKPGLAWGKYLEIGHLRRVLRVPDEVYEVWQFFRTLRLKDASLGSVL